MRKILFLDVDGVLNTLADCREMTFAPLNQHLLQKLAAIVHVTKCDIVLSSSWRHYPEYQDALDKAFLALSLPRWISITPELNGFRKDEIWQWLKNNIQEPCRAVILDDEPDAKFEAFDRNLRVSFIQTNPDIGLSDHHVSLITWLFKDD